MRSRRRSALELCATLINHMSSARIESAIREAVEPKLILIPAGWFRMGSEAGQENERPVHRVWTDVFYLAACQVTHAEYACFLHASGIAAPPLWDDPNFNHSGQPVVAVSW